VSLNAWIVNAHALPPSQGGGTRHYSLVKTLNENGFNATLIASDAHYAFGKRLTSRRGRELLEGVPFYWVPAPIYKGNSLRRVLNHIVFAQRVAALRPNPDLPKPDVIVGSSPHFFAAWAAERLARRMGVPFVMEIRDFWPQSLVDFGGVPESHPMVRWMRGIEPRLYKNSARIISLLGRAHDYLKSFGIPEDRVVWVPNGIDLRIAPAPTPQPNNTPFVVTYSGAHGVANGLDTLLDAAAKLKGEPIKIRLVGDGPLKPALVARAQAENLTNVEFLDSVAKSQIFGVLQQSDAFTTLAVDAAVFKWGISPNKVFDYLAMARPIVFAGRVPDSPVEMAKAGIITDVDAESLAAGLRSASQLSLEERTVLAANGRAYVEANHDMEKLALRFGDALRAAANA